MNELDLYKISFKLFLSLAIGVLFGIERDMKRLIDKEAESIHFGGIRTFALIGLLGGLSGYTGILLSHPIYIYGFVAVAIFVITGYVVEHRFAKNDLGMTTEFSALLVYTLGALSVLGQVEIVVATTVVVLFLLSQKQPIQLWTSKLKPVELLASLKFALVLLVIFPFLRGIEPVVWQNIPIVDPFNIWKMVVLISSVSYLGYFFARMVGRENGILISGLLGGLASSTAVTHTFASKNVAIKEKETTLILAAATLLANAVSFLRGLVVVGVLNLPLLSLVWFPVVVMSLLCLLPAFYLIWISKHNHFASKTEVELESPFNLKPALLFGFFYALVVFFVQLALKHLGDAGIYLLSFVSGFPDIDPIAVTLAGLTGSKILLSVGAFSLVLALGSNLIFKALIARMGGKLFSKWVTSCLVITSILGILLAALFFLL